MNTRDARYRRKVKARICAHCTTPALTHSVLCGWHLERQRNYDRNRATKIANAVANLLPVPNASV